jgi:hypothetical protein
MRNTVGMTSTDFSKILLDAFLYDMILWLQILGSNSYLSWTDIVSFVMPFEKTGRCTERRMRLLSHGY